MSDPKEFIEALGTRKTQTKEVIRLITHASSMPHSATLPDGLIHTEILANQLAMLNAAQVLTAMVGKIERRLDDLEEWHQGRLKPSPYSGTGEEVPPAGRS